MTACAAQTTTMPAKSRCRVATVCQGRRFFHTVDENRSHVFGLLDLALAQQPDLVCLPETFTTAGVPGNDARQFAESLSGPTITAVAERARRHGCYILCPLLTQRDGSVFNSAVLLDRAGEIAGIYDKRHPVTSSCDYTVFENGVRPGRPLPVFDCDFGRVGVQICFDAGFPEDWAELARQDVRLVIWSSAYNGGQRLQHFAAVHHYYVVTSVLTDNARIIDPCGTVLAETNGQLGVVVRDINLDFAVCHYDFNYSIPERLLAAYPGRVEVRTHWDDGLFLVEPTDPTLTIEQLQTELGFETYRQYHERHRAAYAAIERGAPVEPQPAAHGQRPMYSKG
jgi:beta-ureidopropionase